MKSNFSSDDAFDLTINHGGELIISQFLHYVGDRKYVLKDCKLEGWSLEKLAATIKGLGYKGTVKIYYATHVHELDRLVEIKDDNDALALTRIALWRQTKSANVFVFHGYDH